MRIIIVASFPESVWQFRGPLLEALLARGLEVHLAAPNALAIRVSGGSASGKISFHDIPLNRTGTNPMSDLSLLFALVRLFARVRPDIVLPYTIKPVVYGSIAAWLARVPRRYALVTGLGYSFTGERRGLLPFVVTSMYRFALSRVQKVFFQNPDDERLFRSLRLMRLGTESTVVNGSGVDLAFYEAQPRPEGPMVFLMIARLLGDKGVREYARAATILKRLHPAVRFQLAGWIDSNPDAISREELDGWVSDGAIDFLGKLDDVRPAIAKSTVYVLPSYREGTPRTVLEAMAIGRAIITTDAPGCRETVVDGQNGVLIPVASVESLVSAMRKFIDCPELSEEMGKHSRRLAEEKYNVHDVNRLMLQEMGVQ